MAASLDRWLVPQTTAELQAEPEDDAKHEEASSSSGGATFTCIVCGEAKLTTQFYRDSTLARGHSSKCKACKEQHKRQYRTSAQKQAALLSEAAGLRADGWDVEVTPRRLLVTRVAANQPTVLEVRATAGDIFQISQNRWEEVKQFAYAVCHHRISQTGEVHKKSVRVKLSTGRKEELARYLLHLTPRDNQVVDHVDGDRLRNTDDNLHVTDAVGNMNNMRMKITNTSGHNGVFHEARGKRWRVRYRQDAVSKHANFSYKPGTGRSNEQAKAEAVAWRAAWDAEHGCTNGQRPKRQREETEAPSELVE